MCGIVGVASPGSTGRYTLSDVKHMADAIVHRGPDAEGFEDLGEAILGMRRLSIIDLQTGDQPIHNEDRTVWVVCNGEIYNFARLRRELIAAGHDFVTESDTEVLVHLYEEYGDDFVQRIEGMFAFALWDTRRRKLIIARDRLGIKPLYYWFKDGHLAFASEIKAFQRLRGFAVSIDEVGLMDYLRLGYCVAPRTIFSGVRRLPPATLLIWCHGDLVERQYWSMPQSVDESRTYNDWVGAVREELQRAVADHMVSDVPVGAFLSGGIDSSSIAAIMADQCDGKLKTFSIGYKGSHVADYYNELPYARIMANGMRSEHTEIEVQPDASSLLPRLMWHLEEPISDSALITTYLVADLAAHDVKVIQSGVGGDEAFAGYNRYLGDYYRNQYHRLPHWCRKFLMPRFAAWLPSGRQNRAMDLARYVKRFVESDELDWRSRYTMYMSIAQQGLVDELLVNDIPVVETGLAKVADREHAEDELLRLFRIDWQAQLSENLLLLTDKMTMARSLECRVPFLDKGLIELAAQIPARHKLPAGNLKGLLKDALRPVLPPEVVNRRKRGFGAPIGHWFKHQLAPLRSVLLDRRTVERRGIFHSDAVERVLTAHDRNREDYSDLILVLMNLEIWSRLFLDGRSYDDVSEELAERSKAA